MQLEQLLSDIESHIEQQYREHQDPRIIYHDVQHTREVVSAVITISGFYGMNDEERFPIIAAAWFHDLAYMFSGPQDHEEKSAVMARQYLEAKGLEEAVISQIEGCIMATRIPQTPHNLAEKIIADADLFHFGKASFQEKSDLLRRETELLTGNEITGTEWRANTLRFMEQHHYFTEFARQELQPSKEIFFRTLKDKQERKLAKLAKKEAEEKVEVQEAETGLHVEVVKKKKKKVDEKPSRGIETLFRLTSRNHMELSALADNKAGIMISVNSIIISVILSVLLGKLGEYPHLVIPTILLLLVNITTVIFGILATRPKIVGDQFTQEDIDNRKINLLFFGHFNKMSLESYQRGILQMIDDKDYLYSSLTKDIYYLGVVLGKKYKYLRWSYTIFMWGLIVSVFAFAIAMFIGTMGGN
ncbi:MAG TPA: Pycsar system effector family protein [Chitinophagaceae bacterium]|nr:Pycsar system effector family protein [Chitinophagaceae bacterium]